MSLRARRSLHRHAAAHPGEPRTRRIFQRDAAGRITGFVERRESWDLLRKRVR